MTQSRRDRFAPDPIAQRAVIKARADYQAACTEIEQHIAAAGRRTAHIALTAANVAATESAAEPKCDLSHCCPGCDWYHGVYDEGLGRDIGWQCRRSSDKKRWPPVELYDA